MSISPRHSRSVWVFSFAHFRNLTRLGITGHTSRVSDKDVDWSPQIRLGSSDSVQTIQILPASRKVPASGRMSHYGGVITNPRQSQDFLAEKVHLPERRSVEYQKIVPASLLAYREGPEIASRHARRPLTPPQPAKEAAPPSRPHPREMYPSEWAPCDLLATGSLVVLHSMAMRQE